MGGRAARRSCLRRGGGGRQAGAAVVSCLAWRCELAVTQRQHVTSEFLTAAAAAALSFDGRSRVWACPGISSMPWCEPR